MGLSSKCYELVKNHKIATSSCPKFTPWTKVAFFQWKLMIILRRKTRLQKHEFILSCAVFTHFFLIYTQSCVIKTQKNTLTMFCSIFTYLFDLAVIPAQSVGLRMAPKDLIVVTCKERGTIFPHNSSYPKYLRVELGNNFDYKAGVFWLLETTVTGMKRIAGTPVSDRESVRGNTDPCVHNHKTPCAGLQLPL